MKKIHWLMACLLWAAAASAGPETSLDGLVAAHGGREALQAIRGYAARHDVTHARVRQSPEPGPPWHRSEGVRCHAMDLAGGGFAAYGRGTAAGSRPYHSAYWLTPEDGESSSRGWYFNIHDGWRAAAEAADLRARSARAMRLAPTVLVRAMAAAPDRVTVLGAAEGGDASRTRFRFEPAAGPALLLAFDNRTRMLRELAAGETTVHFDGYEMVDGFPVSRRMKLARGGETVRRIHVKEAAFGSDFPAVPEALLGLEPMSPADSHSRAVSSLARLKGTSATPESMTGVTEAAEAVCPP